MKFFVFLIIAIFFFVSCNSLNHDLHDSPDAHDFDKDTEIIDETTDKTPDVPDETPDETPDEAPDVPDENPDVECLDLRYNENTVKTPFPFKDKDGRPTFCRPGCDTPTENDPQCVRNIWEWEHIVQPEKVKGNIMLYASAHGRFINCWYRFDKNKSYCPTKPWSTTGAIEMLYGTFSGKWQLWKNSSHFKIRDWECYCKETGLCPFED